MKPIVVGLIVAEVVITGFVSIILVGALPAQILIFLLLLLIQGAVWSMIIRRWSNNRQSLQEIKEAPKD